MKKSALWDVATAHASFWHTLYKYGCDDIDTSVFYCSTSNGVGLSDAFFTGDIALDAKTLSDFLDNYGTIMDDEELTELIVATLSFFDSYGADVPLDLVAEFVNKIYPEFATDILFATYGGYPSYWSMISPEKYEKAKAFATKGIADEYAGFIEKTDEYHDNVQVNSEKILKECTDKGMHLGIIAKYNVPTVPLCKESEYVSDDTVETSKASFGATTAKYGGVLTKSQIANADPKYLSCDHMIDASTCLYPDCTWFIKDIAHSKFPDCIDKLIVEICNYDGQMTVFDNELYPQYLKYTEGDIVPLADAPVEKTETESLLQRLSRFLRSLIMILKRLFEK